MSENLVIGNNPESQDDLTVSESLVLGAEVKAQTNNKDVTLNNQAGEEVGRMVDGGATVSNFTSVGHGFGLKMPAFSVATGKTLLAQQSGSIIHVDPTSDFVLTLPDVTAAGDIGLTYTIVNTKVVGGGKTLEIKTNGQDGKDSIVLVQTQTSSANVISHATGKDVLTIAAETSAHTLTRITCINAVIDSTTPGNNVVTWFAEVIGGTKAAGVA